MADGPHARVEKSVDWRMCTCSPRRMLGTRIDPRRWRLSADLTSSRHRRTQTSPEATMDSDRFDALTRSLSEGMTRRGLTRLLGGLALSGLVPPLAGAAKKDGKGKK